MPAQENRLRRRVAALPQTGPGRVAIPLVNAPDLQQGAAKKT